MGTWERYLLGVKHCFEVSDATTVDVLISAQLGGAERSAWVAQSLRRFVDRVGARNVFVLTNNPNLLLIASVMRWLSGLARSPLIEADHVVSTHFTAFESKAEVVQAIVERTANGSIESTLRC